MGSWERSHHNIFPNFIMTSDWLLGSESVYVPSLLPYMGDEDDPTTVTFGRFYDFCVVIRSIQYWKRERTYKITSSPRFTNIIICDIIIQYIQCLTDTENDVCIFGFHHGYRFLSVDLFLQHTRFYFFVPFSVHDLWFRWIYWYSTGVQNYFSLLIDRCIFYKVN